MSLKAPGFVNIAGVVGAPLGYPWNSDLALRLYAAKDENPRLYAAIDHANYKAKMSLGVAIAEWIVWRFAGHTDLTDAVYRIEAAWANAIVPLYAGDLTCRMTHDDDKFPVEGALELGLCVLGETNASFCEGSIYLAEPVVKLATVAAQVLPDKDIFSDWLSSTIRRLAQTFPKTTDYDSASGTYDASLEKPVPREFFDQAFTYDDAAATAVIQEFLRTLDPKRNPFLRSADEMNAAGFKGIPYQV